MAQQVGGADPDQPSWVIHSGCQGVERGTHSTQDGRRGIAAQPGERILTEAQQTLALRDMPAAEREHTEALWADDAHVLPVAYVRGYFKAELDATGKVEFRQVGGYDVTPDESSLRLPNISTASSDTGGAYDMYMSISIWRTSTKGTYEWGVETYSDWRAGQSGAGALCNQAEDTLSASWAGDLRIHSKSGSGRYNSGIVPFSIYLSDVTNNEGLGYSFREWADLGSSCWLMDYARFATYIREDTWKSRTDNVSGQYLHSKGGSSYSLSYRNASFTISPNDSNKWTAAVVTSFSH